MCSLLPSALWQNPSTKVARAAARARLRSPPRAEELCAALLRLTRLAHSGLRPHPAQLAGYLAAMGLPPLLSLCRALSTSSVPAGVKRSPKGGAAQGLERSTCGTQAGPATQADMSAKGRPHTGAVQGRDAAPAAFLHRNWVRGTQSSPGGRRCTRASVGGSPSVDTRQLKKQPVALAAHVH